MRRLLTVAATLALLVGVLGPVQPVLAAPANDNFANAEVISGLPFYAYVDLVEATMEPGEPDPSCRYGDGDQSVWFTYTPSTTGKLTVRSESGLAVVAVYTGSAIDTLTEIGCPWTSQGLTFDAAAGATYYFLLSPMYWSYTGPFDFQLTVTPPPTASFYYYPSDPSSFDTVNYNDSSYDPAGVGIKTQTWDFGDGATATGCCPQHRYGADGDYSVYLAVETYDGRTASITQTLAVRTHDVAITRFIVPGSASSSQTRQITVSISNSRYPETVMVQLDKSGPGGWTVVGTLTQSVPIRSAYRTTPFSFNYTFTKDDAAVGKVSFRAVAYIPSARDALPADNTAISFPTRVTK